MNNLCETSMNTVKVVKDYFVDVNEKVSAMSGLGLSKIVEDFANVYSRLDDYTKNQMSKAYRYKEAATKTLNETISDMTDGRIKDIKELASSSDPFILNAVLNQIKNLTNIVARNSKSSKNIDEVIKTNEYRSLLKGSQWAASTGMFTQKLLSGYVFKQWLGMEAEDFDGLFLNRDQIFKQNSIVDSFRADYVNTYKAVETRTTALRNKFTNIVNNERAIKGGLKTEIISKLMKYFDQDNTNESAMRFEIDKLIESGKLKKLENESESDASKRYESLMKDVYNEWKVFNYGSANPNLQNYYKNWENFKDSYVYNIISGGVDYVKAIYSAISSGELKDKDMMTQMSDNERSIVEMFAKYYFKDGNVNGRDVELFKKYTGIDPDADPFFLRKEYVPYLKDETNRKMFSSSRGNGIPFAKFLSERIERDRLDPDKESDLISNFNMDLESYRSMITKASEVLFARRARNHIVNDDGYASWKDNHTMEDRVYRKYIDMTLNDLSGERRQTSKTVEMLRQTSLALLGLENAVTLLGSGPKNLIQGASSLLMNVNVDEFRAKASGKLSIKNALQSNESIGDLSFQDVASTTNIIADNMISGRRAEIQLYESKDGKFEENYTKGLQKIFNFVESSNSYGMLLPFKALFGIGKSVPDTFVGTLLTNAGSEKFLRNWRKHEAFSMIGFEFHADRAMLDSSTTSSDVKETIKNKWSKKNVNNTVRDIIDKYKYDLYEKDNRYFGDFGQDTKPFWTHVMLNDSDTISGVIGGFMLANWYMFRQAGNFGLSTGLMSTAKMAGEMIAGKPSNATSAPVAVPMVVLGALGLDLYNTFFGTDSDLNSPLISALNQMQDVGVATKATALFTAPLFNFNMTPETANSIMTSLSRYSGGMFAGKTVDSIAQDIRKDLSPFSTMFQSIKNYPVHLMRGLNGLMASTNITKFKESQDYVNSAYQITFPAIDNILGGNNDILRMFANTLSAVSSTVNTVRASDSDKSAMATVRNRRWQKLMSDLFGYNVLQVFSGQKAFDKRVADADYKVYLDGFSAGALDEFDTKVNVLKFESEEWNKAQGDEDDSQI